MSEDVYVRLRVFLDRLPARACPTRTVNVRLPRLSSAARFTLSLALVCLLGVGSTSCDRLQQRLIERRAEDMLQGDRQDWLSDGALHVILCGTGSPLPDLARAGPCVAVIAGERLFLVDVGLGSQEKLQLWRVPRANLAGIFLTHFHSDHIGELGEVVMQSWLAGRRDPLPVYGPPGVEQVVFGFQQAYALDTSYRIAHHGQEAMPPAGAKSRARRVEIGQDGAAPVLDEGGLRVTAIRVDHQPVKPAYGYRFDYGGRAAVVSGDSARSANLARHTRGADLLVHDVLATHLIEPLSEFVANRGDRRLAKLMGDVIEYHASPADAAFVAGESDVRMVVFTHLVPSVPSLLASRFFLQGIENTSSPQVVLGQDGMHFTLPANSQEILREKLD
jgi:ribonuclease Z